jgi:DNA-binding FadR family transcriptional regulator
MGRLDDHTWRRAIELFLIAGDYAQEGALPPLEDLAWDLHTTSDDMLQALTRLAELGVVEMQYQDAWLIVNFARRQAAVTSAERSRLPPAEKLSVEDWR